MPDLVPDYPRFGGAHPDSAVLCNAFVQAGIHDPASGRPYSEAMIAGLGGGIGFGYLVVERQSGPPALALSARRCGLPAGHPPGLVEAALRRFGVRVARRQGSSRRLAQQALQDALDAGKAALCSVEPPLLPHRGLPARLRGMGPQWVAAVGRADDLVFLDDLCQKPVPVPAERLADARAAWRPGRQQLLTLAPPDAPVDLAAMLREAILDTCDQLLSPPAGNLGFAGMERWAGLLVNERNRRGWLRLFEQPAALAGALADMYEQLRYRGATPGAMRPLYADFLEEAAAALGDDRLGSAAGALRQSGELWGRLADLALPEEIPPLWRCREIAEQRQALLRTRGAAATGQMRRLWAERESLVAGFDSPWSAEDLRFRFKAMALALREILAIERPAILALRGAAAG